MDDARDRIDALEAAVANQAAALASKDQQILRLEQQVRDLLERLNRNSTNSNKPPSSDPPGTRSERGGKAPGGRGRGGQIGHPGAKRDLVAPEDVDEFVDVFPLECEDCCAPLPRTPDADAHRFQVTELPPVVPLITEYRQHSVACPSCRHKTRAPCDAIPSSSFGPRLASVVALLTGVYHLSRRSTVAVLHDLLGVEISLGAVSAIEARVSAAVQPAVAEAWEKVEQANVKHTDGTSWYQSGVLCALWTVASRVATVFKIVATANKETLEGLLSKRRGILVSDRATALTFWAMERRQICWAHLLRKFISFSERGGTAGAIGDELLEYVGIMFAYWDDFKTRKLNREQFRDVMRPLREQVEAAIQRAAASGLAQVAGSCADMLEHRAALWTFVEHDGVEPTNNHAERELRAFVLWRKRSFGTRSERGNQFAERMMTVAHTARKQNRNVLAFLTACMAPGAGGKNPSLFDVVA